MSSQEKWEEEKFTYTGPVENLNPMQINKKIVLSKMIVEKIGKCRTENVFNVLKKCLSFKYF